MVGIVLVSHSRLLATAAQGLVRSMTGPALPLAIAAGVGENHAELGTDAMEISEAIRSVQGPDGVLVLMDMGSAILSAETALDLMDPDERRNIRFCAGAFVEGAVAAGVTANLGAPLADVHGEALAALRQKERALHDGEPEEGESSPAGSKESGADAATGGKSLRFKVRLAHGLHARPAAKLIGVARPFEAELTLRNLSNGRGPVPLRSLSRVASLEILPGHEVEVVASGTDADAALTGIDDLARDNFGEASSGAPVSRPAETSRTGPLPVSDGLAIGPGIYFRAAAFEIPTEKVTDAAAERKRLRRAIAAVEAKLDERAGEMAGKVGRAAAGIYEAQILALQDPELVGTALQLILDGHRNAASAWSEASRQIAERYASLQDAYLRERAADMEDVGRQVLEELGVKAAEGPALTEPSILIVDDLSPRQVSGLRADLALGVILLDGGPTAHSSILLRALGIPAVVQARSALAAEDLATGSCGLLAVDGTTGKIWRHPDAALLEELKNRQAALRRRAAQERELAASPGATLDGHRVTILANLGHAGEGDDAVRAGAEGVGLLRTEFLFLDRETPPTEAEQIEALRSIAAALGDRPVTVRTLDIGGDKPVGYLSRAPENNPFLGVRALRLCFARPDLFTVQLRAILQAAHGRDLRIMFPMVADLSDLRRARHALEQAHQQLEQEERDHRWPIRTGIMIEIPSAALQAGELAKDAEFFSIGTNDLTQYALAADRGNPALAAYQDALHPAVLRLIDLVVRGARTHNRPVAVCGEAGSNPAAAQLLVGLGVEELSVAPSRIPKLKAVLRAHKWTEMEQVAARALGCTSSAEVRALLESSLP